MTRPAYDWTVLAAALREHYTRDSAIFQTFSAMNRKLSALHTQLNRTFLETSQIDVGMGWDGPSPPPTRRFNTRDRVRTKCRSAVRDDDCFRPGSLGFIRGYDANGDPLVVFDGHPGTSFPCHADQLELASSAKASAAKVPEKSKQRFWEGDCIKHNYGDRKAAIVLRREVHKGGWVRIYYNMYGCESWDRPESLKLVAPGPNHPEEDK